MIVSSLSVISIDTTVSLLGCTYVLGALIILNLLAVIYSILDVRVQRCKGITARVLFNMWPSIFGGFLYFINSRFLVIFLNKWVQLLQGLILEHLLGLVFTQEIVALTNCFSESTCFLKVVASNQTWIIAKIRCQIGVILKSNTYKKAKIGLLLKTQIGYSYWAGDCLGTPQISQDCILLCCFHHGLT